MPGSVLGAEDIEVNKIERISALLELIFSRSIRLKNKNIIYRV